ncbi:MAG: NAD(P)/FAD-dependent oxidoreductase [Gammaproteobacteria bacterium]|jgi:predicted Rossmann fold flavoprotein|nr:NAD(P)/FAD-dependent oxidoreductase [Gammaproteobacteria bacterium]
MNSAEADNHFDAIVLGGGAAGLMCAITAGNRGKRVVVLEGSNKIGKKILMSGGGRCNFTNLHIDPSAYLSANPHFCKSALSRYTQWDFIELVNKHDISYHEKDSEAGLGQLFCDESSKDILAMLEAECTDAGVQIKTDCPIDSVTQLNSDAVFVVNTGHHSFSCDALVLATGGLSIPKMGATDFGYRLANQFKLNVLETRASLVPFTFTGSIHKLTEKLSGVSLPAILSNDKAAFREAILFTHRGLSGPAALQISNYWLPGEAIYANLLPDSDAEALLLSAKQQQPKTLLRTALTEHLPRALVIGLQDTYWPDMAVTKLAEIPDNKLKTIADMLNNWELKPAATEGYRTAEVTLGGIDTNELSSKSMESKKVPGLYCIGEVIDVTGHLGGYNFQWAWSSAVAAGSAL